MRATNAKGGESYLRSQYEAVCKERDYLQIQVEKLERDNQELKKTVFELSHLLSLQTPSTGRIFRLDEHRREPDAGAIGIDSAGGLMAHSEQEDERFSHSEIELRGHTGAVYCANFSRNGRWLASGGLDKSIRVWDARSSYKQIACLSEHQQLVSDIAWLDDSDDGGKSAHILCSSSFDHTVRTWDFARNQSIGTTRLESFVLCLHSANRCAALDEEKGVFAGTINGTVALLDSRTSDVSLSWSHSSGIQSICTVDDVVICTGDNEGVLTWWDVRTGDAIAATPADQSHSHTRVCDVKCARLGGNTLSDSLFAANFSDHILRLYSVRSDEESGGTQESLSSPISPSLNPQMLHALRGHITGNWPIRCAIYVGPRYKHPAAYQYLPNRTGLRRLSERESDDFTHSQVDISTSPSSGNEDVYSIQSVGERRRPSRVHEWSKSLMLASASADGRVYIYDLSFQKANEGRLWQVLEGHTDKVYSVAYHPIEPILASASGDGTVRIWSPRKRTSHLEVSLGSS